MLVGIFCLRLIYLFLMIDSNILIGLFDLLNNNVSGVFHVIIPNT